MIHFVRLLAMTLHVFFPLKHFSSHHHDQRLFHFVLLLAGVRTSHNMGASSIVSACVTSSADISGLGTVWGLFAYDEKMYEHHVLPHEQCALY